MKPAQAGAEQRKLRYIVLLCKIVQIIYAPPDGCHRQAGERYENEFYESPPAFIYLFCDFFHLILHYLLLVSLFVNKMRIDLRVNRWKADSGVYSPTVVSETFG